MRFEIYKSGNEYRWRLRAANDEIVADGEPYVQKAECQLAIQLVKSTNAATPVIDLA